MLGNQTTNKTFGKCFYMNIKILLFKICHSSIRPPAGELKSILKKSIQISGGKSNHEYFAATSLISIAT